MSCLFLVQLFLFVVVTGQPEGWRMIDRFYGFRYSLHANEAVMDKVLKFADKLGCFGWIQHVQDNVFVGEARCAKERGILFEKEIQALHEGIPTNFALKVYSDTKIRLHFSHFKVLERERDTCFLDEPHKCSDVKVGSGTGKKTNDDGSSSPRNEL